MKKILIFDDINSIPGNMIKIMEGIKDILIANRSLESIQSNQEVREVVSELNKLIAFYKIQAYHFTRADKDDIIQKGL